MLYAFEDCELDTDKVELRVGGAPVAVEPQVFELLRFLIERRDRVATREEIIEGVWGGRFVSDSAVSSRIKSARQAIGDDGRAQRMIKTVHGSGFRFVAEVAEGAPAATVSGPAPAPVEAPQSPRPSIAVLPFRLVGVAAPDFPVTEALPADLITELSRLHWLFVIARGSSFRFRGAAARPDRVRTELGARYCLTGVIEVVGETLSVSVELCDTDSEGVVWAERFGGALGAVHEIRGEISAAVAAALEIRIPMNEAQRARLRMPGRLDAWSLYHLGLHHMYRFNHADNERAKGLFERVIALEPGFARAHAGLSFVHFQDAFLRYADRERAMELARARATESLEKDPLDPFGHFAMGRVLWLTNDVEGSLPWLAQANQLNPNYAHARYSAGFAEAMLGQPQASLANIDSASSLSPIDPLTYAMHGIRAFSYIELGRVTEGADWAERAASATGAHPLVEMIAVAAHDLNGNAARAANWAASAKKKAPHLAKIDFVRAFPFRDTRTAKSIFGALEKHGF